MVDANWLKRQYRCDLYNGLPLPFLIPLMVVISSSAGDKLLFIMHISLLIHEMVGCSAGW